MDVNLSSEEVEKVKGLLEVLPPALEALNTSTNILFLLSAGLVGYFCYVFYSKWLENKKDLHGNNRLMRLIDECNQTMGGCKEAMRMMIDMMQNGGR